ncbi:MAG: creatininase family protein [Hyphomicrobiales bacterium]|nr:creatininase family protein [Hyphomicrobiales bacterium]MDE2115109.1 creatininase family protein [Hyphomicrobiales bacterium]
MSLAAGLLMCSTSTMAAPLHSVMFEENTSTEIHDFVAAGHTTVLIPIGGTEQTGPYVVTGKHNIRVKALATAIAKKLGDALVAPVLAYVPEGNISPPTAHMRYDGTISIPRSAFAALLQGAALSFAAHGFKHIVFLGDHGGYQADLREVVAKLNRKWAQAPGHPLALYIPQYYGTVDGAFAQTLLAHGVTRAQIGTHGGASDTALLLAIDPGAVRMAQLKDSGLPTPAEGINGDPRRASAELGQLGIDEIVEATTNAIRTAVKNAAQ